MHTPDHTPACRESPHFCICGTTRPGTITTPGEKPQLMEPLTAAGGWGLRQDNLTIDDLPQISIARGGIKYPSAHELLPKIRAERDTAQENARFWRRQTIYLAVLALAWMAVGVSYAMGWI
jgi:hypothetical protein